MSTKALEKKKGAGWPPARVGCHPRPSQAIRWHSNRGTMSAAARSQSIRHKATIGNGGREPDGLWAT